MLDVEVKVVAPTKGRYEAKHHNLAGAAPAHTAVDGAMRGMFGRDAMYLGLASLQMVLSTALTPVLTRVLGTRQYGLVSLAIAISQVLGVLCALGLPVGIQKEYSRRPLHEVYRIVSLAVVLDSVVVTVLCCLGPQWRGVVGAPDGLLVILATLWGGATAAILTSLALLRSEARFRRYAVISLLQSVGSQCLGVGAIIVWHPSASVYLWGVVAGQGLSVCAGIAVLGRLSLKFPSRAALVETAGFSLPLVLQQLSGLALVAADRVIVQRDMGAVATARYSVAYNVGQLAMVLLSLINGAWMPRIYAFKSDADRNALLVRARDAVNWLLWPAALAIATGGPVALMVWVPSSYHVTGLRSVVAFVAVASISYGRYLANVRRLLSEGRTRQVGLATAVAAACNIGLNLLLVPRWGIVAAAAATWASYEVAGAVTGRGLKAVAWSRASVMYLLVAGGCLASKWLALTGPALWVRCAAGVVCALGAVVAVRAIRGGHSGAGAVPSGPVPTGVPGGGAAL